MDAASIRNAMQLTFKACGEKLYARTPAGELAFGESQGLYEWRYGHCVIYTGGDRQGSSGGALHHSSGHPGPFLQGLALASRAYLKLTN